MYEYRNMYSHTGLQHVRVVTDHIKGVNPAVTDGKSGEGDECGVALVKRGVVLVNAASESGDVGCVAGGRSSGGEGGGKQCCA